MDNPDIINPDIIIQMENLYPASLGSNAYLNANFLSNKGVRESIFLYDAAADILEKELSQESRGSPRRNTILNQLTYCYKAMAEETSLPEFQRIELPSPWTPYYYNKRISDIALELKNTSLKINLN